jgi:hypothetical protein
MSTVEAPLTVLDGITQLSELGRGLDGKLRRLIGWRQRYLTGQFANPRFCLDDSELGAVELNWPPTEVVQQLLLDAIQRLNQEVLSDLSMVAQLAVTIRTSLEAATGRQENMTAAPSSPPPSTPEMLAGIHGYHPPTA